MPIVREEFEGETPNKSGKRSALPWVIGCLVALVVLPILLGILSLLAAIALPPFVQARNRAKSATCIVNVQRINQAKQKVALENAYTNGTTVTMLQISKYMGSARPPTCPSGGVYTLNPIGEDATCSVHNPQSFSRRPHSPPATSQPDAASTPLESSP
jgi:type II secretory pathway pseudopilin PulG